MNRTSIEWTHRPETGGAAGGVTWKPIRARLRGLSGQVYSSHSGTFCTRISPGCTNCYASVINKRFGNGLEYTVPNLEKIEFYLNEKIFAEPFRRKKPATIFVGDMFDLFHEAIDPFLVGAVFGMMLKCPQHTFQLLTKRAARMCELISPYGVSPGSLMGQNIWLGVSVESQKYADERIPLLLQTPAAVRFLSVEPMLEAVNLREVCSCGHIHSETCCEIIRDAHGSYACGCPSRCGIQMGIDWVICGGESGPRARPFNLAWAESLHEQCKTWDVPFFMKQIGSNATFNERPYPFREKIGAYDRKGGDPAEWPEHLRIREL